MTMTTDLMILTGIPSPPGTKRAASSRLSRAWRWMDQGGVCRSAFLVLTALVAHLLSAPPLSAAVAVTAPIIAPSPVLDGEVSDGRITRAVGDALLRDQWMFADAVDVSTSSGIVTLTGSVGNLLLQERAVRLAESLRGVRGVIDQLTVVPVSRSDVDIRRDILLALQEDPATRSYQVTVAVHHGMVTLSGSVGSYAEVHLAGRIAKGVVGVTGIRNEVAFNTSVSRTDAEISADVHARLQWDVWLNGDPITVAVSSRKVTLTGALGNAAARWLAFDDAWVTGVTAVDVTGMTIDPRLRDDARRQMKYATHADGEITQAIQAAFRLDPRVMSSPPEVMVSGGEAILSGSVDNLRAKLAAQQDAENTVDVDDVVNQIKVRPKERRSDAEMTVPLTALMLSDPLLADSDVHGVVVDRIATLTGVVDNQLQRAEAQEVASRVPGIVAIRNRIRVDAEFPTLFYDRPGSGPSPYSPANIYAVRPAISDDQIKAAIDHGFLWSPYVNRDDIHVVVKGGVATLTGTVTSWIGWKAVDQAARQSGATEVVDRVEIRKGSWWWP